MEHKRRSLQGNNSRVSKTRVSHEMADVQQRKGKADCSSADPFSVYNRLPSNLSYLLIHI